MDGRKMNTQIDGEMETWTDGLTDGWIDRWKMEECMDKRIGGYMDGEADE